VTNEQLGMFFWQYNSDMIADYILKVRQDENIAIAFIDYPILMMNF